MIDHPSTKAPAKYDIPGETAGWVEADSGAEGGAITPSQCVQPKMAARVRTSHCAHCHFWRSAIGELVRGNGLGIACAATCLSVVVPLRIPMVKTRSERFGDQVYHTLLIRVLC